MFFLFILLINLDTTINDIEYKAGKYSLSNFPDKIQYAEKIEVLLWAKKKVNSNPKNPSIGQLPNFTDSFFMVVSDQNN